MSHHAHTWTIEPNPQLELICALWLVLFEDEKPQIGPSPLVDKSRAAEFVNKCLNSNQQAALKWPLSVLGMPTAIGLVLRAIHAAHLDEQRQAAWRAVNDILSDATVQAYLEGAMNALHAHVEFAPNTIREVHTTSRYAIPGIIAPLLGDSLTVRVVPSLFMRPAPGGKIGFHVDTPERRTLTLVFGYAGQFENGMLDWLQWYRLGIWHILARTYWAKRFAALDLPAASQHAAFERLPDAFRAKVGIHDFTVSHHKDWASYLVDNLVAATKVLGEEALDGSAAGAEQAKWFMSLGRFHIGWFIDHLRGRSLDDVSLSQLMDDWTRDVPSLTSNEPTFPGPLGACESPLWNHNPRLIFSPSVGAMTQRIMQIWFAKYWPVKPAVASVEEPCSGDWDSHCNLVFCSSKDEAWTRPLLRRVGLDGAAAGSLAFVCRNESQPSHWSRVCLAPDDESLIVIHQNVRYYADWTSMEDGVRESGLITYRADGVRLAGKAEGPA